MSNYDSTPSPKIISADDREAIKKFFDSPERVGAGSSCPRCGANIEWNYTQADDMLLHITWHRNLERAIRAGYSYSHPGMRI